MADLYYLSSIVYCPLSISGLIDDGPWAIVVQNRILLINFIIQEFILLRTCIIYRLSSIIYCPHAIVFPSTFQPRNHVDR